MVGTAASEPTATAVPVPSDREGPATGRVGRQRKIFASGRHAEFSAAERGRLATHLSLVCLSRLPRMYVPYTHVRLNLVGPVSGVRHMRGASQLCSQRQPVAAQ